MEIKKLVDIVLPVHTTKQKDFDELFKTAIESIRKQTEYINNVIVVHSKDETLVKFLNEFNFDLDTNIKLVENDGKTDFQSQINLGVKNSESEYFSILEFDDEYSSIWFKNVYEHIKAYPKEDGFLPIVTDTNAKGKVVGFTNEATFATNLNADLGFLTEEMLLEYQNFQTSGMVLKVSSFNSVGGFKSNLKLVFVYEFLLRLCKFNKKIRTIPKLGYKHTNLRTDSLFWSYKEGANKITPNEVAFWLEKAKTVYVNKEDDEIKYEPTNVDA